MVSPVAFSVHKESAALSFPPRFANRYRTSHVEKGCRRGLEDGGMQFSTTSSCSATVIVASVEASKVFRVSPLDAVAVHMGTATAATLPVFS